MLNEESLNLILLLLSVALLKSNFEISFKTSCIQKQQEGYTLFRTPDQIATLPPHPQLTDVNQGTSKIIHFGLHYDPNFSYEKTNPEVLPRAKSI